MAEELGALVHEGAGNQHEIDVAFAHACGPKIKDDSMLPMIGVQPIIDLPSRHIEISQDDVWLAGGLQHDKGFLQGVVD
jgi:hypothetical protein